MLKRIATWAIALSAITLAVLGTTGTANRQDVIVDYDADEAESSVCAVIVAQDGSGDYQFIQDAIDDPNACEIMVMPGIYKENVSIGRNVVIRSYDGPLTTVIDGSPGAASSAAISVNASLNVTIEGLCICNGKYGIYINYGDRVILRNCVFWANTSHGIYIRDGWSLNVTPSTHIYNCVSAYNGASGIFLGQYHILYSQDSVPPTTCMNSILVNNGSYAIRIYTCAYLKNEAAVSLNYNCYWNNSAGDFYCGIGPGEKISAGQNSIYLDPRFCNTIGGDFRLRSDSPCVDAGGPGWAFIDPDGTDNDMGVYGGPGSATFFEDCNDGPIVRSLRLSPGSVPQGSPLTIRATASVR